MTLQPDQLDQVDLLLSSEFVAGIDEAPITEVRAKRDACQRAEVALSFVRRVLQGKLDLIEAEKTRRVDGGEVDTAALIERLPEILAGPPAGTSAPHPPIAIMPGVAAGMSEAFDVELSTIEGVKDLASNLGTLDDLQLEEVAARIRATEAQVSARRRALHERIDRLQAQIVARYKSGEADVESLLRQGLAGAGQ
jgi:hypothetical protein